MLKKLAVSLGVFVIVFGTLFIPRTHAATMWGPSQWRTDDGKYELKIRTTSKERYVWVQVYNLYLKGNGRNEPFFGSHNKLKVRLCSASTGNCTSYKNFTTVDGLAWFFDMKPATYYVDVRDPYPDHYIKGWIQAETYSP
ncbi:MAG: hypothetical protein WB502_12940 [Thermoactinomyces sp.]